jgi:SAM-dependent methyltransferase
MVLSVNSLAELVQLANEEDFRYFSHYAKFSAEKKREFFTALAALDIKIKDKNVLDLGPGTGDALDAAVELGAKKTYFVDQEPFFWRYSILKGHHGWLQHYMVKPYFPPELRGAVDFIWSKGSINCAQVNDAASFGLEQMKFKLKGFSFPRWVRELKALLAPGGSALLMPAMGYQQGTVYDAVYKTHHHWWCPDRDRFMESYFVRTLFDEGFKPVTDIPYFNEPNSFPVGLFYTAPQ